MRLSLSVFGVLLLTALAAPAAGAQTGAFTGIVTGDTLGHGVAHAEVSLPELHMTTIADERGEFRFSEVPAGHYAVVARAIGFELLNATIDIIAGQTLDGELTLLPNVTRLDSMRTTASATPRVIPRLQEFEARAKARISGYFLTDSMLRRRDRDNMASVIGMLPNVKLVESDKGVYVASTHGGNTGKPIFETGGSAQGCLYTVYLDDQKIFQSGDGTDPIDFSKFHVEDFYGVEVYPSATTAPAQYSGTGVSCGIIALWSRPGHSP